MIHLPKPNSKKYSLSYGPSQKCKTPLQDSNLYTAFEKAINPFVFNNKYVLEVNSKNAILSMMAKDSKARLVILHNPNKHQNEILKRVLIDNRMDEFVKVMDHKIDLTNFVEFKNELGRIIFTFEVWYKHYKEFIKEKEDFDEIFIEWQSKLKEAVEQRRMLRDRIERKDVMFENDEDFDIESSTEAVSSFDTPSSLESIEDEVEEEEFENTNSVENRLSFTENGRKIDHSSLIILGLTNKLSHKILNPHLLLKILHLMIRQKPTVISQTKSKPMNRHTIFCLYIFKNLHRFFW